MSEHHQRHRPWSVTILVGLVLIVATVNLVRTVTALSSWVTLSEILPFSPIYLVISGAVWFVIGLPLIWGLWRGESWAPQWTMLVILAYSLYFWSDRLFLPAYKGRNENWVFVVVMNILILISSYLTLKRKGAQEFFGESYEQKS